MRKWLSLFICLLALFLPNYSKAASVSSQVTYTPENSGVDAWQGGQVVLVNHYVMNNNEITYNPILSQTVDFKIEWKSPEGITGQEFANALTNNSTLELGSQVVSLDKSSFTVSGDKISYKFSQKGFDFFALLKWLASLIFNPEITIKTKLVLDVNQLSANLAMDNSVNKVVTRGKLPPNQNKELLFSTSFYNRQNVNTLNRNVSLATWNSYISPWASDFAASDQNGKLDDTQSNNTQEVIGTERVLKGLDYKSREINVPITQTIDSHSFSRGVNLYNKTVTNSSIDVSAPVIVNTYADTPEVHSLVRKSTYTFNGVDDGTTFSPVNMIVKQETSLRLVLEDYPTNLSKNKDILVSGLIESEGSQDKYFYKINHGAPNYIETVKVDESKFEATIPGMLTGTYEISFGVENEYGLRKEQSFTLTVPEENVKIHSISSEINFGKHKIPKVGEKIFNINDFYVEVEDTYLDKKEWLLSVKVDKEMQATDGTMLPADIYLDAQGREPLRVNETLSEVYRNEEVTNGFKKPIEFLANEGLYLQMKSSNVKTNQAYNGELGFVLQTGP